MTRLFLIRHGESVAQVEQVVMGHDQCRGLSPLGRRQAEALRDRLSRTGEIHADVIGPGDKVLLVDDLIATGGTAVAAVSLMRRTGAEVSHSGFVIDLYDLGGADKLRATGVRVEALIPFEGH